jgi:hypothetical protein
LKRKRVVSERERDSGKTFHRQSGKRGEADPGNWRLREGEIHCKDNEDHADKHMLQEAVRDGAEQAAAPVEANEDRVGVEKEQPEANDDWEKNDREKAAAEEWTAASKIKPGQVRNKEDDSAATERFQAIAFGFASAPAGEMCEQSRQSKVVSALFGWASSHWKTGLNACHCCHEQEILAAKASAHCCMAAAISWSREALERTTVIGSCAMMR